MPQSFCACTCNQALAPCVCGADFPALRQVLAPGTGKAGHNRRPRGRRTALLCGGCPCDHALLVVNSCPTGDVIYTGDEPEERCFRTIMKLIPDLLLLFLISALHDKVS